MVVDFHFLCYNRTNLFITLLQNVWMQLKKSHLEVFVKALQATEDVLTFPESRVRDSFLKKLLESYQDYMTFRDELLIKLASPIEGKVNMYTFTPEYLKELEVLNEEETELPDEPKIKEFLEKTTYKPKVGEADLLDDIIKLL